VLISAAVLRAADAPYAIEQVELTGPGPGEVLVETAGAGLCHTDVLGRSGRFPFEKLITSYPLSQVNQAEADAASGAAVKPVLIPDHPA
jgi:aryl-alcohol dehydrogenase